MMDPHGDRDPSQRVDAQVLPHAHLISTQRYASHARLDMQKVTDWLLAAPKIARDVAPFFWTYLDAPGDGQIFLTWQPLPRLGTEFASDGYLWSGPEVMFTQDVGNGLILEVYIQKAGFKPMVEPYTMHSRRRFRLTPAKVPNPNMPAAQCDPCLWIVQYGPSEAHERIPASSVQFDTRTTSVMNVRMQLQRAGQILRKEFMLADRPNWPSIPMPSRMYATPHGPRPPVPQSMAYPPHPAGPPSKRGSRAAHQAAAQQHHAQQQQQHHPHHSMAGGPVFELDDDEDTSRGDFFDHMSPRDVSLARYEQNHEWMEELFNSPYRIGQITMADLGLGLKGELAPLTEGIFEAQGANALAQIPKKPYVGTLDKGLADEFRKRVEAQVEATTAEIKRLEAEHARAMADLEWGRQFTRAERELRGAVGETGSEFWRLEGRTDGMEESGGAGSGSGPHWGANSRGGRTADDIVAGVENVLGRKAVKVRNVLRVQDGGYQEPVIEPPPPPPVVEPPQQPDEAGSSVMVAAAPGSSAAMSRHPSQAGSQVGNSDIDMGGTAAGLLDQMDTGVSSTSTPVNSFPTPQPQLSAVPSATATPTANAGVPSPQPPLPPAVAATEDVEMGGTPGASAGGVTKETTPPTAPDQGTGSGDWVVIPKSTVSAAPSPGAQASATASANASVALPPSTSAPGASTPSALAVAGPSPAADSTAGQEQAAAAGQTPPKAGSAALTPGDFSSLGDIEGAGDDALAGFGAGVDDDLGMDMVEDSAFGDAFHGVSESRDNDAGGVASGSVTGAGAGGTPHGAEQL